MEIALREKTLENQKLRRKVRYYTHMHVKKVIEHDTENDQCIQSDISDKHSDNVRIYRLLK